MVTTVKKQGLGRGLQALLQGALNQTEVNSKTADTVPQTPMDTTQSEYANVPLEKVVPGSAQPRQSMDQTELRELADSIQSQGILQPLVVRQKENGLYEIIAGERRYRAATLLGLETVPVIIKTVSDEKAVAMALIENIQRADLNVMEEAIGLERLHREFKLTHQQIAEAVGKSRAGVTNLLRLLTLSPDVQALLKEQKIDFGHAKVLLGVKGELQSQLAQQVAQDKLSVRETERLLADTLAVDAAEEEEEATLVSTKPTPVDPNIRTLERELSARLGARLKIRHQTESGKGRLVIYYHSLDELDGILDHIQ